MTEQHTSSTRQPSPGSAQAVIAHIDSIAELWAAGDTFDGIVAALRLPTTGSQLREVVLGNPDLVKRLDEHHDVRALSLVDQATEWAYAAAATGEPPGYRIGIDTMMKLAAKLDPKAWGDVKKVELTGKGGGPIQTRGDLSLSPSEAYERMVARN